ncbi:hypothetical protein [Mycobacterium marinum]|uniref:hypothetical protein n=1 Tax=Mycobacterium marinum TaxID=1781 RepID=UPI002358DD45|nr:hypothetical protein [Mycobacterium marinum]MDC8970837.1 hypothetical protein [Mycobacterium marinum]
MLDDSHPFFLIPLVQLVADGFGQRTYGEPVNALAKQLGDAVVFNDVGQRCVTRATAAALFLDRAAKQEVEKRRNAEKAAEFRRRKQERLERQQQREQAQPTPPPPRSDLPAALAAAEYDPWKRD